MEKVKKDGKVAIVYSPGFGAGWSSWNRDCAEALCMDSRIVIPVLNGDNEEAIRIAQKLFPGSYLGGGCQLQVLWLEEGSQFEIDEYDGSESVHVIGNRVYHQA